MMRTGEVRGAALGLISVAFVAYAAANLLHNRFGLDLAIVPAALFVGLVVWRRRRWQLLAAAFFIGAPSFLFLRWSELTSPTDMLHFSNHAALLAGGVLAVSSVVAVLIPNRMADLQIQS